jgi:hypothetical protein
MRRDLVRVLIVSALTAMIPARANAQAVPNKLPRIGLEAGEPLTKSALPATPFGRSPSTSKEAVLDFHGFILMPMRFSLLKRENPTAGQSETALHSPPSIPQEETRFEYTGVVPTPWVQLNFSYGNSVVAAHAIIAARDATDAAGLFDATKQLGVADAFVAANLSSLLNTPFEVKVGAFTGRYGAMGMYDAGRYGTVLMARTSTVGVTTSIGLDLGKGFGLALEHGIGTSLGRPGSDVVPEAWNDFGYTGAQGTVGSDAPKGTGSTLVNHLHAVLGYSDLAQLGLHYFTAWTQDDQVTPNDVHDGTIRVMGADTRFTVGRGGHLYVGGSYTKAKYAATVSGVLQVLNTRGGPELINEYLGPNSNGNGSLTTYGAQYDLSVARMLYGDFFQGKSADVRLSLFGMGTSVKSPDPVYGGVSKLKMGFEATYSMLSWFAASARVDHVEGDTSDSTKSFNSFSPRLLFHTDWLSRDEFAVQYSFFQYGENVLTRAGHPPVPDPAAPRDKHVFVVSGTFWW